MQLRMEQLVNFGILVVIIGFMIIFMGIFLGAKDSTSKSKVAIGGFIGPIPFGFGNDKTMVWFVTTLTVVMILIWLFFYMSKIYH